MNKDNILKVMREQSGTPSLRLPAGIDFSEDAGQVSVTLEAKSVTKNMQENAAAFEGWILAIKALMPEWTFTLDWETPADIENGHYQRFLYRAAKFDTLFGAWFSVKNPKALSESKITGDGQTLLLNRPSTEASLRLNDAKDSEENRIENDLIKEQPEELLQLFSLNKGALQRQLPMGVFDSKVTKGKAIFTGGKSAADLWAVSKDKTTLNLFELKAGENRQVGVISELFFYAMVLSDEQRKIMKREGPEGDLIKQTTQLNAVILAPDLHPLIHNLSLFDLLNTASESIHFGFVQLSTDQPYKFKKVYV